MPRGGYRPGAGRPTGAKSAPHKPKVPKPKPVKRVRAKSADPVITPVEAGITDPAPKSTVTVPLSIAIDQDMIQPEDYRFEGWEDFALYVLNAPNSEVPMADKIRAMQALSASENRRKTVSSEKTKEKRAAEKSSRDGVMGAGSKFAPRSV